jgi:hypothetical protein
LLVNLLLIIKNQAVDQRRKVIHRLFLAVRLTLHFLLRKTIDHHLVKLVKHLHFGRPQVFRYLADIGISHPLVLVRLSIVR